MQRVRESGAPNPRWDVLSKPFPSRLRDLWRRDTGRFQKVGVVVDFKKIVLQIHQCHPLNTRRTWHLESICLIPSSHHSVIQVCLLTELFLNSREFCHKFSVISRFFISRELFRIYRLDQMKNNLFLKLHLKLSPDQYQHRSIFLNRFLFILGLRSIFIQST